MRKLVCIVICGVLLSCRGDQKKEPAQQQPGSSAGKHEQRRDTLTFSYDSVKVYSKRPVPKNTRLIDTAKAVIEFPVFKDSVLNKMLVDKVGFTSSNGERKTSVSYQAIAAGFIKGFDEYEQENDDHYQSWFFDSRFKVLLQKPGYIALQLDNVEYVGGAHANSFSLYVNYDLNTYKEIALESLLKPGGLQKLNLIAEQIFRKNEGLTPTASLSDVYFFENDKFKLNNNFTITATGLQFKYNPYEIKPFAAGETIVKIPFAQIKDLIRPNSLLSRFL
jgi:hypothetical protein